MGVVGDLKGDGEAAGVGDRAKARGGDEEIMMIAADGMLGMPLIAHWRRLETANVVQLT